MCAPNKEKEHVCEENCIWNPTGFVQDLENLENWLNLPKVREYLE